MPRPDDIVLDKSLVDASVRLIISSTCQYTGRVVSVDCRHSSLCLADVVCFTADEFHSSGSSASATEQVHTVDGMQRFYSEEIQRLVVISAGTLSPSSIFERSKIDEKYADKSLQKKFKDSSLTNHEQTTVSALNTKCERDQIQPDLISVSNYNGDMIKSISQQSNVVQNPLSKSMLFSSTDGQQLDILSDSDRNDSIDNGRTNEILEKSRLFASEDQKYKESMLMLQLDEAKQRENLLREQLNEKDRKLKAMSLLITKISRNRRYSQQLDEERHWENEEPMGCHMGDDISEASLARKLQDSHLIELETLQNQSAAKSVSAHTPSLIDQPSHTCIILPRQSPSTTDHEFVLIDSESCVCALVDSLADCQQMALCFLEHTTPIGRNAHPSMLAMVTQHRMFVCDLLACSLVTVIKHLRAPVFESNRVQKIIHDCRAISDLFYNQCALTLSNVYDTHVAELVIHAQKHGELPTRTLPNLASILMMRLDLRRDQVYAPSEHVQAAQSTVQRPVDQRAVRQQLHNMCHLHALQCSQVQLMLSEFCCSVRLYRDCLRFCESRVAAQAASEVHRIPSTVKRYWATKFNQTEMRAAKAESKLEHLQNGIRFARKNRY